MNLRNFRGDYSIGLDIGSASVGWSTVESEGELLRFKGQPAWGSRLFDSANTAAAARAPRGQRRRYVRRRWRLNLLQNLLQEEVERIDPDFFIRLRQSRLVKADPNKTTSGYRWPIFNDSDFTEVDYYKQFPTIYHLRKHLSQSEDKADIRLVYLALHNIVKCRGNFLRQGQSISSKNAKPDDAVRDFCSELCEWCESLGEERPSVDVDGIIQTITSTEKGLTNKDRASKISDMLHVSLGDSAADKKLNKALAHAIVGLQADFADVFGPIQVDKTKIRLSDDEKVEALSEACPDDGKSLFKAICDVHSAYVLQDILSDAPGESISANMVAKYEKYGDDLRTLKDLVKEYRGGALYDSFFRGGMYEDGSGYDPANSGAYTKYNLHKLAYDDFKKEVVAAFAGTAAEEDPRYLRMMEDFEHQRFLRRLKTSDNGSIYYQLHLEEMEAILDRQGKFYPALKAERDKLLSLVTFRIPYYVGPLTQRNARLDSRGNARFAWSERIAGMEGVAITPWNWDKVIDKNKSAENFIKRMTGTCTYLQGKDVLPKSSLLYEEYCVLNELNGMRWTKDGDDEQRFDDEQRKGMLRDLFRKNRRVTYKKIEDWLDQNGYGTSLHVSGGQGETGLESKLGSYIFFAKDILGVDEIPMSDYPMIEEIILWSTLFEDRSILRERLQGEYGSLGQGRLSDEQINKICKKRLTGWGRLSRELLVGVSADTQLGKKTIMDVLRDGDPNSDGRRGRSMVFMEVLRDEHLGFQQKIDDMNRAYFEEVGDALSVNDLPGSPALRRGINQAIKIVDEISGIAGKAPANIFIEVTRDDDMEKRGDRTKRRYDNLNNALKELKSQDPDLWREWQTISASDLDERMTLYFMQRGKCMYSGEPINIGQLHNAGLYEVDHIIPQSFVKDDSFENKVLVLREKNQQKTDSMLIDPNVRRKMSGYWRSLHDAKLIGDKKLNSLTCSSLSERKMRGFIARQLVETSQTVKLVQSILKVKYPDTKIVPVKASLSHDLREAAGLAKCREANDFHHAHDAFLACRVGLFIQRCYPDIYEKPIMYARAMQKFVKEESGAFNRRHRAPGSSGFIIGRFACRHVVKETGEIEWDGPDEIENIRHALGCKQCYITRMPYEDSGAFWDATIYSPRHPKAALPLKEGLDPKVYGGYSSQQFAHFFIYEALGKKGRTVFRFAEMPVWLASRLSGGQNALEKYARQLAENEGLEFVGIQRARVLKRQLVEIDGERFFITGKGEMRNACEIAFSLDEMALLARYVSEKQGKEYKGPLPEASASDVMEHVIDYMESRASRLFGRILGTVSLDDFLSRFNGLCEEEKLEVIIRITALANAGNRVADMTPVGGVKTAGQVKATFHKLLSDPDVDFFIIDQSVTGMFEQRVKVGI